MGNTYLLAAYGALRLTGPSHYLISKAKYIGDFDTELIYDMYSFVSFPALIPDGNTSIKMEVYEISEDILKVLKRVQEYEGGHKIESMYTMTEIETPYGTALTSFYNNKVSNKVKVESGDWIRFKQSLIKDKEIIKYGME
jgi:gamma-glutamylcyclotransferase (GGCT)/AIG2-like uncharacterized protein YtfP